MTRVAVVTGAGGFLGSHIARHLAANGWRVIGVGRGTATIKAENPSFCECSLPSDSFDSILKANKPELVVHAAGTASIENSVREPHLDFQGSVELTAYVLETIRKSCPGTHFIMLSSASVYGSPESLPISESQETSPVSPYGYHKRMAELLVQQAEQLYGLKVTVLRIFSAYGEGIRRQVIFDLCSKLTAIGQAPITLRGTGAETRDFIHAHDVARAVLHVVEHKIFDTLNLASGEQTSIAKLGELVRSHLGIAATIQFDGTVPQGSPRFWQADISKLRSLGFQPEISLQQGIEQFCRWFKQTHVPAPNETAIVNLSSPQPEFEQSYAQLSIGFSAMGTWLGGIAYLDILTKALAQLPAQEKPRMVLVFNDLEGFELHARILPRVDEIIFVGPKFRDVALPATEQLAVRKVSTLQEAIDCLDVFYPINSDMHPSAKAVSWIPDFQHLHLPQLFSQADRDDRDRRYRLIAEQAHHVVFSSHDAAGDFSRFAQKPRARIHVLPFYSLPEQEWYDADASAIQAKYNLPKKYLICCNQFWEHKNHLGLFSAIKILRGHGVHVPLVCTGALTESRNPGYIEKVKNTLRESGIEDLVYVLGALPREDQLQLMRASIAVVQPSLFEGWSTVVEDARVLGKTIFLSQLNVHREQAPRWGIYFDPHNPLDLAEKIVQEAAQLHAGPDRERESLARADSVRFAAEYARKFLAMAKQVYSGSSRRIGAPAIHATSSIDLSIVLATKNRGHLLKNMLASIPQATRGLKYEIIVIDGGSTDETAELLEGTPYAEVFQEEVVLGPGRHTWPQLYNFGFARAKGEWATFASDDITFDSGCFSTAITALRHAPPTTAGGIFFYRNEVTEEAAWQHLGIDFLARSLPLLNYGIVRTKVFAELGGLDTEYQFYAADGDLTYKIAHKGMHLSPLPNCTIMHHNLLDTHKKVNLQAVTADMATFKRKWGFLGEGEGVNPRRMFWDPALNETFSLGLRDNIPYLHLCKVWQVVAKTQAGQSSEAVACLQELTTLAIPVRVMHELMAYLKAQVVQQLQTVQRE